jgi:hypothetical protein
MELLSTQCTLVTHEVIVSELEKCLRLVDHHLKLCAAETDPDLKASQLGKAVYWSIEVDIERTFEAILSEKTNGIPA